MKKKRPYSKVLSGIVKKHPDGFGFLICKDQKHPDIYIPRHQMKGILTDDEIEVSAFVRRGRFYGQVTKIIRRARSQVLGPLHRISKKMACIKDGESGSDIVFDTSSFPSVEEGAWVQVHITSYPGSSKGFRGEMVGVLGNFPQALSDNVKMLQKYNIPYIFSQSALNESQNCFKELKEENSKYRRDLKSLPFITIDSKSAKDFDDAIYVQKKENGWILFVSIADVSLFVKENGVLDKEAYLRGNSTYFPNFVSPMLPKNLSQNLCSLKPGEDRFTFTAEIYFDDQGQKEKYLFYESTISSHMRLTYGQAQQIIDDFEPEMVSPAIRESVKNATCLAQALMHRRFKEGSLNLEIPETEIRVNQRGEPTDIIQAKRLFSHQLIEELMLACNQSVAEFLSRRKSPSLYRVHDTPKIDDLSHVFLFFQSIDSNSARPSQNSPSKKNFFKKDYKDQSVEKTLPIQKKLSHWIKKMQNHPKKLVMHNLILRAMPQACYSAFNRGHFGLSFSQYTHFTSPIRRYSDLIVHRILKKELGFLNLSLSKNELESKAEFLSQCEQRSVQSERQIENIKKARFMHQFLGEEFAGMISSITRFGFFSTLRKYNVDGLVSLDDLGGRWIFDPVQLILKEARSGYMLRQGDLVLVQVMSSNVDQGQIDFNLIEHNGQTFQRRTKKKSIRKKSKRKFKRRNKNFK